MCVCVCACVILQGFQTRPNTSYPHSTQLFRWPRFTRLSPTRCSVQTRCAGGPIPVQRVGLLAAIIACTSTALETLSFVSSCRLLSLSLSLFPCVCLRLSLSASGSFVLLSVPTPPSLHSHPFDPHPYNHFPHNPPYIIPCPGSAAGCWTLPQGLCWPCCWPRRSFRPSCPAPSSSSRSGWLISTTPESWI